MAGLFKTEHRKRDGFDVRCNFASGSLILFAGILALLLSQPALAQRGSTAAIFGTVTDPQGAVVSGATVKALQSATGFSQITTTNNAGQYQLQFLRVGHYSLVVTKAGFKKYLRSGILLQVNQSSKLDVALLVGDTTSVVQVSGSTPLVNTRNATLTQVVNSQQVVDLPLNGRQLVGLSLLSAGVVPATDANASSGITNQGDGVKSAIGSMTLSINGNPNNDNEYTLDGADNNDTMSNLGLPFPFPDAVREFSIQTAGEGVDVGKAAGGTVNIVTRSGSNQIHGDAFWFVRNSVFNANNFFSRIPDQLKRNQAGGTLGGPIIKNRLFLFGGYERTWIRQRLGANLLQAIPEAHRVGDFSDLLEGPHPVQLMDPSTNLPYPNNQIPKAEWSPAFQKLMAWWPVPDADGFVNSPVAKNQDYYQVITRADYKLNEANSFYARYFRQYTNQPHELVDHNIGTSDNGKQLTTQSGAVGWTAVLAPNLVTNTVLAINYAPGFRTYDAPWGDIRQALGVDINPGDPEIAVSLAGTSDFDIGGNGRPTAFKRGNFDLRNSWEYSFNKNDLTFGFDFTLNRYNEYNAYHSGGVFEFNGQCSGFDQADALLGCLSSFTQGIGEFEFRRYHYQGFFVGDSYRATPRLTLNFGLRWEPYTPITDTENRNVIFRQDAYLAGQRSEVWRNSPPGLFYPGDKADGKTVPKGGVSGSPNLLGPRVGFAYELTSDGRTVVRGGYGRFYSMPELYMYNALSDQAPFGYDENFVGGSFDNPYEGRESANVFPLKPGFKTPDLAFPIPATDYAQWPDYKVPSTDEWNLSVERQVGASWVLQASYVGSHSSNMYSAYDINPPVYNFSESLEENQRTIQQRRPRQEFQDLRIIRSLYTANYNALQLVANKRFSGGLTLNANYTWSKQLGYVVNTGSLEEMCCMDDPFDIYRYYGPSRWDVRNRFVASAVYNLPSTASLVQSRALDVVTRNWTLSPIVTIRSGMPFTVGASGDLAAGAGSPHGVKLGPLQLSNGRSDVQKAAQWFNTANVAPPAPGTYGNIGRNTVLGPNFINYDAAFYRTIKLPFTETTNLQIRAEGFNVFNRVNFYQPESSVGSSSFGRITQTIGDPRILQFALKLVF